MGESVAAAAAGLLQCASEGAPGDPPGASSSSSSSSGTAFSGANGPLGWLLSDKGPFHHSQEFTDFTERYQQGFTTKYKIYSWLQTHFFSLRPCALQGVQQCPFSP
ncbi:hypothetical protein WMY93_024822 [Mugilogobius chulae]|uniref:Uncharacterized protein n=1 Tax=Mugilogobius chulae TaxID=88201 RepID=A0AAW0N556_9GOBI